jgi:hypothetical protein
MKMPIKWDVWRTEAADANKFHQAQMGNQLMVAFEYDLCVFRKLYKHNPILCDKDALDVLITLEVF